MREILFRGKRVDNGEWVFGYYAKYRNIRNEVYTAILQYAECEGDVYSDGIVAVIPETVGQYTGKTDNNGKKIFEGDIVKEPYGWAGLVTFCTDGIGSCGCCVPEFDGSGFKAIIKKLDKGVSMSNCIVIGNIHDNPELWEEDMK